MSIFGDVHVRQADLRSRLMEWRQTFSQQQQRGGNKCKDVGFGEAKENVNVNVMTQIQQQQKPQNRPAKLEPVDSMVKTLQFELEKLHIKEQDEARIRVEERAELESLRAEKDSVMMERFKIDTLDSNLKNSQSRLQFAVDEINRLNFQNSCLEQQVTEWKGKMSTHVSNVKDMQIIKDREKDLLYRARKDREREVKALKEAHNVEKKNWIKEKMAYEQQSETMMANMVMQMENLQKVAFERIHALELELERKNGATLEER